MTCLFRVFDTLIRFVRFCGGGGMTHSVRGFDTVITCVKLCGVRDI